MKLCKNFIQAKQVLLSCFCKNCKKYKQFNEKNGGLFLKNIQNWGKNFL